MRALLVILAIALSLPACKKTDGTPDGGTSQRPDAGEPDAGAELPPRKFVAHLSGGEVMPPVLRAAGGTVEFTLDGAKTELRYHAEFSSLGGVKADVHRGKPGENGEALFELQPFNTVLDGTQEVTPEIVRDLEAGLLYVDLHSHTQPDGESRGQIVNPGETVWTAPLTGTQLDPVVQTTEAGFASLVLTADKLHARFTLETSATPTEVALVALDGTKVLTVPQPEREMTATLPLTAAQAEQLTTGQLAVVVATSAHAAGELRGQIVQPGETVLSAKLSGGEVVPPAATQATGRALVLVKATRDELRALVTSSVQPTEAHLHLGVATKTGDALHTLEPLGKTMTGTAALNETQAAALLAGRGYVDVHTAGNAAGELRGQLVLPGETLYAARMLGTQALPPNTSPHSGAAQLLVNAERTKVRYALETTAIATSLRLDIALPGTPGPTKASGRGVGGVLEGEIAVSPGDLTALEEGRWAATVVTSAFPNGELRGQIARPGETLFVAALTGDATVPPSDSLASGTGMFLLSADGASVRCLVTSVLQASGAHVHQAPGGVIGPVVFGLQTSGQTMTGSATITAEQRAALERGLLYVNVQTQAHADGEIRGQILKPGEVLYAARLDGGSQSPPVESNAIGGIGAILSADKLELRYDAVLTGLAPIAAKLHDGPVGSNGPVLYDLTFANGALTGTLQPTAQDLEKLEFGELYVNVSTDAHPDGEIRGNLVRRTP